MKSLQATAIHVSTSRSSSSLRRHATSDLLAEHDPMAVWSANTELAHPPRLVSEFLGERRAICHELGIELVNAFDRDVHKVGMVAQLVGWNSVLSLESPCSGVGASDDTFILAWPTESIVSTQSG
jgi:hypothetical protein